MEMLIYALVGAIIGFFAAWTLKSREASLEHNLREEQKNTLEEKFKAIATDVLRFNSEDLLKLNKKDLDSTKDLIGSNLKNKEEDFQKLIGEVNRSIDSLKTRVNDFEKERGTQLGSLGESIKQVIETGSRMNDAASTIKTVLSSNTAVRGRWGEAVLKNLLEDSGLTEGIDFFVQETISGEDATSLRPDIIVNLPGELRLAIDSKASLDEFFKAVEEKQETLKDEHLIKFVSALKERIRGLAGKEYQKHLDKKVPYVVMFIPGEAAVRAAFEKDPSLYREAQEKKVMLASPATIMPLILLIAHAWRQHRSSVNALKLSDEVIDLGNRLKVFFNHVGDIGASLSQAIKRFNLTVGSWETKVLPKIEQINTLGGNIQNDADLKVIEEEPRTPKQLLEPPKGEESQ